MNRNNYTLTCDVNINVPIIWRRPDIEDNFTYQATSIQRAPTKIIYRTSHIDGNIYSWKNHHDGFCFNHNVRYSIGVFEGPLAPNWIGKNKPWHIFILRLETEVELGIANSSVVRVYDNFRYKHILSPSGFLQLAAVELKYLLYPAVIVFFLVWFKTTFNFTTPLNYLPHEIKNSDLHQFISSREVGTLFEHKLKDRSITCIIFPFLTLICNLFYLFGKTDSVNT